MRHILCVGLVALAAGAASAGIIGVTGGLEAPPSSLGPFTLREFARDTRPILGEVLDVPSPLGGTVRFDELMTHTRAGLGGWGTWSHGYVGDVYFTYLHPPGESRTLDFTEVATELGGAGAFRLSIAPSHSDGVTFDLIAATQSGLETSLRIEVGHPTLGRWLGFYATDGDVISSIRIQTNRTFGLAEFAVAAVPEPSSLLVLLLLTLVRFGRISRCW